VVVPADGPTKHVPVQTSASSSFVVYLRALVASGVHGCVCCRSVVSSALLLSLLFTHRIILDHLAA